MFFTLNYTGLNFNRIDGGIACSDYLKIGL